MILSVEAVTAGYGNGPDILHEVSITLHEGEIVAIIGPNGAGKSTLLKSILGLTSLRHGTVHHGSRDLTPLPVASRIRSGIAFVTQGLNIFPDLTVAENLEMAAYTMTNRSEVQQKYAEIMAFFPQLQAYARHTAGLLSGGERQMLALGMGLMLSPEVLLLDEPSIGLAPKVITEVFQQIQRIRDQGTSILMVEQNAAKALEISDRGYVLELGRNALTGTGASLLADPKVGSLYLGR
ncbi:ABC transporter ATP-binding protein [Candidatus Peribacteria bacterium]|nr:ABC transporter ATP-binding protein [Candidatus Peribacteria bacterium]